MLQSLRKVTTYLCSRWDCDLVGKSGCHIRFVNDRRNFIMFAGKYDRYRYKSAFGKDHIRLKFFDQSLCFTESFQYAEWIGKVLNTEIAAQFTGRDSVVRDAEWLDELFFDSLIRANIPKDVESERYWG